jgi:hypothetical protein
MVIVIEDIFRNREGAHLCMALCVSSLSPPQRKEMGPAFKDIIRCAESLTAQSVKDVNGRKGSCEKGQTATVPINLHYLHSAPVPCPSPLHIKKVSPEKPHALASVVPHACATVSLVNLPSQTSPSDATLCVNLPQQSRKISRAVSVNAKSSSP